MSWYKVTFTSSEIINGKAIRMQSEFAEIFVRAGARRLEAGLFSQLHGNDHFFSPAAAEMALPVVRAYNGVECSPPKRSEVSGLVVHAGADAVPFAPES